MAVAPRFFHILVVVAALLAPSEAARMRGNPIRRVITMMQVMVKKCDQSAKREEELFGEFICQCKERLNELKASILAAEASSVILKGALDETLAAEQMIRADLKLQRADKKAAEDSLYSAKQIRKRERETYAIQYPIQIEALKSLKLAIRALKKGLKKNAFLQMPEASVLQGLLAMGQPSEKGDRDTLTAFLQEGDESEQGKSIVTVLKHLRSGLWIEKEALMASEARSEAEFQSLRSAKESLITEKFARIAELLMRHAKIKIKLANDRADYDTCMAGLNSDREAFYVKKTSCSERERKYAILKKEFAKENVALSDTIKMLSEDDAATVFGKSSATRSAAAANFLQIGSSSRHRKQNLQDALRILQDTSAQLPGQQSLQLLVKHTASVSKHGSTKGFDKIMGLIDNMINLLTKEATIEKLKKENCVAELAKNQVIADALKTKLYNRRAELGSSKEGLATVIEAMKQIDRDMAKLAIMLKKTTIQRKKERAEFETVRSDSNSAIEILEIAKNRLKTVYPAALIQRSQAADEVSDEEVPDFLQVDESESSEEHELSYSDEYKLMTKAKRKPQAKGNVVITMLGYIQENLKDELKTARATEDDSKKEYDAMVAKANAKKAESRKTITQKLGLKAGIEMDIQITLEKIGFREEELLKTNEVLKSLHGTYESPACDKIIANFDLRTHLRAREVVGLERAKATFQDTVQTRKNIKAAISKR